jgi:hypothetical protein
MIFGNFSLGGLFHREPEISPFERWYDGSWRMQEVSRLEVEALDSLKRGVDQRLEEKKKEFKKLEMAIGIEIDEAAIHREIQDILEMDEEALNALQRDIERRLRNKREEFNGLVGRYRGQ